jgi:hypothetical protein
MVELHDVWWVQLLAIGTWLVLRRVSHRTSTSTITPGHRVDLVRIRGTPPPIRFTDAIAIFLMIRPIVLRIRPS